ncbi:LysE family translocator [Phreatobacter stygius]|uniref:LysE family translocator n=1 Tax=Phreatobacter stygius TaxID=1940610 RepID=A0A4D7AW12_9HYPH|nr:LysE family translocator [Phreatobacter stygius]QCI65229.1 LysE family translocator [Phreatobacter stygius]
MFSLVEIGTYMAVVLALFLVPGPAVLLTLARSIKGGARSGIATGLGIAAGDALHTLMAVLGLSAILMTSALAFDIVKYCGAAYLIYLGYCAWRERGGNLDMPRVARVSGATAFRQAILTEMLNPKTALFFLSFLPQFVHPERGSAALQLVMLGAIFVAMSAAFTSVLALMAAPAAGWISRNRAIGRWQGKVIGSIYVGLGIQLALQQRN